ncbi:hypothetical protein [Raoultibacter massiliensis]|uniref:DUF2798 domain-containing protein n=1 Tax=Raoultibacter massiliensis TaxID=1852371 RepID=A0ABV1JBG3_9ACTN|nr:hypothetical protein [Raoultibacter massiliensis]
MKHTQQIRYRDCITGKAGAPRDKAGKTVFQIMMVFFMVAVMVTFNWNLHTDDHSPLHFALSLYEYPVMFAIALTVRLLIANPIVGRFADNVLAKRLDGVVRSVAITLANVLFMASIMGVFGLAVTGGGFENITWEAYSSLFPATWIAAFCFNFFVVGPLVKMLYYGFVAPAVAAYENESEKKRVSAAMRALAGKGALAARGERGENA